MFIGRQDAVFDFFLEATTAMKKRKDKRKCQAIELQRCALFHSFIDVIFSHVADERLRAAGLNQNVGLVSRLLLQEEAKKLFTGCKHTNALESEKRKGKKKHLSSHHLSHA